MPFGPQVTYSLDRQASVRDGPAIGPRQAVIPAGGSEAGITRFRPRLDSVKEGDKRSVHAPERIPHRGAVHLNGT
jgi:hypothetical protein